MDPQYEITLVKSLSQLVPQSELQKKSVVDSLITSSYHSTWDVLQNANLQGLTDLSYQEIPSIGEIKIV